MKKSLDSSPLDALIESLIWSWKTNNDSRFIGLFTKDAKIQHPYFGIAISPRTAMKVINSAVEPKTKLIHQKHLSGIGDGVNDIVEVRFQEIGDKGNRKLNHICEIDLEIKVVNCKISKLKVLKFNSRQNKTNLVTQEIERINLGNLTSNEIAIALAECWGSNNMIKFISLFSESAKINHLALPKPMSPNEIADIMNSDVNVESELKSLKIVSGNGFGLEDRVELKFNEKGRKNFLWWKFVSVMNISAHIQNYRICEMTVHGYSQN
jgi:hypothetical protein